MPILERLRTWARRIKADAVTLWFAARHPDTPWPAKLACAVAVAYALSPIDLIPDFIPVLGFLDDVLLLPALMWLALRLLTLGRYPHLPLRVSDPMSSRSSWVTAFGFLCLVGLPLAILVFRYG